jgi:ubiquinone/menaquinone biosynthesis C-methylase UbiE
MNRVPEPELMNDAAQAQAYALADFSEPHDFFVAQFRARFPRHAPRRVLDLGCGPADVSLRFARAHPRCTLLGIDGAEAMLRHGRAAVAGAGLAGRISLVRGYLPEARPPARAFDTVISNSLLHHLRDPHALWSTLAHAAAPGAAVYVMDLMRPASRAAARSLVAAHAGGEPAVLVRDFYHSLLAAYTPAEVRTQLVRAGLSRLKVEAVSDRHLIAWGWVDGE